MYNFTACRLECEETYTPPLETHKQQPQRVDRRIKGIDGSPVLILAESEYSISHCNYSCFYQNEVDNDCASNIMEIKSDFLRPLIFPTQAGSGVADAWPASHRPLNEFSLSPMVEARVHCHCQEVGSQDLGKGWGQRRADMVQGRGAYSHS